MNSENFLKNIGKFDYIYRKFKKYEMFWNSNEYFNGVASYRHIDIWLHCRISKRHHSDSDLFPHTGTVIKAI